MELIRDDVSKAFNSMRRSYNAGYETFTHPISGEVLAGRDLHPLHPDEFMEWFNKSQPVDLEAQARADERAIRFLVTKAKESVTWTAKTRPYSSAS